MEAKLKNSTAKSMREDVKYFINPGDANVFANLPILTLAQLRGPFTSHALSNSACDRKFHLANISFFLNFF